VGVQPRSSQVGRQRAHVEPLARDEAPTSQPERPACIRVPHTAGLRVRGRAADPATSRTVGLASSDTAEAQRSRTADYAAMHTL
jgi:hypothetical protein